MKNKLTAILALLVSTAAFFACTEETLSLGSPVIDQPFLPVDTAPIVEEYYFKGKIDSMHITMQSPLQGVSYFSDSISYGSCDTNRTVIGHTTGLASALGQKLEVRFLKCELNTADSLLNLSKFKLAAYPYGSSTLASLTEGVEVIWTAQNGQVWRTRPGTGQNTNQSFRILQLDTVRAVGDTTTDLVVTGLMNNIRLFDGVRFIPITEAEFSLPIAKL